MQRIPSLLDDVVAGEHSLSSTSAFLYTLRQYLRYPSDTHTDLSIQSNTTTNVTCFSFTSSHVGLHTQATKKHIRIFCTRMILHHATLVAYASAMCQGLDASITNRYRVTCQNILTSIFLPLFPCHQEENGFRGAALIGRIGDGNACSDVIGRERERESLSEPPVCHRNRINARKAF